MKSSNTLRYATLCMIAAGLVSASAHADTKTGDSYGDWAVECHASGPDNNDKNICVLTQTVVDKDKKLKLLKLIIGRGKDAPFFTALVPLGISIPAGVTATVDQHTPISLTIQTCLQQGCVATTALDEKLLKEIRSGEKLALNFTLRPTAKSVSINGSLKGMKDGMKALNL